MTLVLSGTSGVALDSIKNSLMFLETAKATTSGTSIDFTGIPSWAKKITVLFNGVSTNGTVGYIIQLGTSAGIENTNYNSYWSVGATAGSRTDSFIFNANVAAANVYSGHMIITFTGSNTWISSSNINGSGSAVGTMQGGNKTLTTGGTILTQIRLTTANGTDTFDNGSVNILIEGYV
jgi:hypothetical protein